MRRILVYSREDAAGVSIASHFGKENTKALPNGVKLFSSDLFDIVELPGSQLYADFLAILFPKSEFIFASKHKSETGKPSLTVHTPGNWCTADFGGLPGRVCISHASFISSILNYFHKNSRLGWDVTLEVTHHGPFLDAPAAFVEIGSSEKEWKNEEAGTIVASAIKKAVETTDAEKDKQKTAAIGAGGNHYSPTFSRLVLEGEPIGHIIPQYVLDGISFESFKEGIEKNVERIEKVLIDWKGTKKEQREKIVSFCSSLGIRWEKS